MIKLKDILFEIEIGKDFLTDPDSTILGPKAKEAYKKFLQAIGREVEPNTEDENKILKAISQFINGGGDQSQSWISYHTQDLKALKSKYPKILDPMSDASTYGSKLYRTMNVKAEVVKEAVKAMGGVKQGTNENALITIPYTGAVEISMASRNTFSLTFDYDIAVTHLPKYKEYNDWTNSVRCIVETDVQAVNNDLLMAPSFLNIWAWDEAETWYASKEPMKCTALHVRQSTLANIL